MHIRGHRPREPYYTTLIMEIKATGRCFSRHLLIALLLIELGPTLAIDNSTEPSSSSSSPLPSRRPPPPNVKLNKCCHLGEFLNATTRGCMAGASEHWVPLVYLIQQQRRFAPIGSSPRFMQFAPNVRPSIAHAANGSCREPDLELFNARQGNLVIFSNGSLYVRELGLLVNPRSYCVDQDAALVCFAPHPLPGGASDEDQQQQLAAAAVTVGNATAAGPVLRLRKCCGKYGEYDAGTKSCNFAARGEEQLRLGPQLAAGSYQTLYGLPECSAGLHNASYVIAGDWQEALLNRSSGALQLAHKNLTAPQYCLEHVQRHGAVKIIACAQHFAHRAYLDEGDDGQTAGARLQKAVLNVGILISVVFLAATLLAGYMLPAVHHALHWRCQIYYVFCLLVGEILLAIEQLNTALESGSAGCLLLAVGMQFFFLAAFFWLNTMCFNIWWTFRDFRPSSLERNQEALRLRLYSAYAWGVPLLISAVAASVDQLPETTLLRPGFGQPYCWFDNRTLSIFAYFYGPIGLLLCANIALFVSTTHQLTCGLWKRDDVKSSTEKSALGKVCLKLVVVMGVTWIADIISWLVGGPHAAWLATDLINALQGVFIFIVVGCQPQVWSACRRICCPRLRHDITNTTNGVQHSSSSHGLPSMAGCGTEFTQNTSMNATTMQCSSHDDAAIDATVAPAAIASEAGGDDGSGDVAATTKIPMETVC